MKNLKRNNIIINAITSICVQAGAIIQGLVIPRILLSYFGSSINGLTSSISQFLNFFSIIEGGVIGVILANLYSPVTNKDEKKMGAVIGAANQFLKRLALLFGGYSVVLGIIYPFFNRAEYSWLFVFSLVLIISVTTFIQYYFTIIPQLIIRADNKVFIYNFVCMLFIIFNIITTVISIRIISEIHVIKLVAALVYLLQPICLNLYVKKYYIIHKNVKADASLIKDRWNGLGASIANLITTNTDVILLTLFSTFQIISVYTVYYTVINSIRNLISSVGMGFQSLLGQQIAKNNDKLLNKYFQQYEFVTYNISGVILSSCMCLIVSFVMLYTKGVNDVDYRQPIFAFLICLAQYFISVREPYIQLTYCAGLFKETQNIAFCESIINILISMALFFKYGIIGVAIGTVISSFYRFIATIVFLRHNVINRPISQTLKKVRLFFVAMIIDFSIGSYIVPKETSIIQWIEYGIIVFMVCVVTHVTISIVFYKEEFISILSALKISRKKGIGDN